MSEAQQRSVRPGTETMGQLDTMGQEAVLVDELAGDRPRPRSRRDRLTKEKLLDWLNPPQREAVLHEGAPGQGRARPGC